MHNEVNLGLRKGVFDCAGIGEFYDCGCAEEEGEEGGGKMGAGGGGGTKATG